MPGRVGVGGGGRGAFRQGFGGAGAPRDDAETASSRGRRSADASRCMRKPNSSASSAKTTGIGARSHHSGNTSVLMAIDPSKKLADAKRKPYQTNSSQPTVPTTSTHIARSPP